MVWLWPEPGALAELESSTVPLPLDPDTLKGDPNVFATHWRCQELPYSADFFFENVSVCLWMCVTCFLLLVCCVCVCVCACVWLLCASACVCVCMSENVSNI